MVKLKRIAAVVCALCMNAWGISDGAYQELSGLLHESAEYNQEIVRTFDELLETKDTTLADNRLEALGRRLAGLYSKMLVLGKYKDIDLQGDDEVKLVELLSDKRYEAMQQGWEVRKRADKINVLKSRGMISSEWTVKPIGIFSVALPARFNDTVTRTRKIMEEFEQLGMELCRRLEEVSDAQAADTAARDMEICMAQIVDKLGVINEYAINEPSSADRVIKEMDERYDAMLLKIAKVVKRIKEEDFFGSERLQGGCLLWGFLNRYVDEDVDAVEGDEEG